MEFLRKLAYPLGWIYAIVVAIRNMLFDDGVIKSQSFKTAIITVGNITTGGTGKTPFVEYLISILKDNYKIVELSRGYKRKTRGFKEASIGTNARQIGDEPFQIYRKYPDIRVVVDADRCHAIREMERSYPETDVFILDDAYQHRYVTPGKSILLIDYNRPLSKDSILPYGNLRENAKGRYRADIVVVTKCPSNMNAFNAREVKNELDLHAYQDLFFSTLRYSIPRQIISGLVVDSLKDKDVLLVTAIANPEPLTEHLISCCNSVKRVLFEDHHNYTIADIKSILASFDSISSEKKIIITTAKDESKFIGMNLPDEFSQYLNVIDVEIGFLFDQKAEFDKKIVGYVEKNKRNSVLFTK